MALHIVLKGVLEEKSVIKLYIEEDGSLSEISNTKGDDGATLRVGWVVFVLCHGGPGIFVNWLVLNNMEIVFWGFSLDGYLVSRVFFYALVEAPNLVPMQIVVESYGVGGP